MSRAESIISTLEFYKAQLERVQQDAADLRITEDEVIERLKKNIIDALKEE